MDISLNVNNGNFGAWKLEDLQTSKPQDLSTSKPLDLQTSRPPDLQTSRPPDLKTSRPPDLDPLQGSEPTADIPEAALSRDDDLGKLVNSVFNLPPPPMPSFAS